MSKDSDGRVAGKGYLGSEDKAFTINTTQDQQVFVPITINTKQQSQNIGINISNSLGANDYKEPQAVLVTAREDEQGHTPIIMATGQGGAEVMKDKCPTLKCNHEAPIVLRKQNGKQ